MRAHALVEAVLRRSSATSLSKVDGFQLGWRWIAVTDRMSPGASLLSCQAPITSFRLAGVVPPSTQCAAVSTQTEETSVPPQKAKPPVALDRDEEGIGAGRSDRAADDASWRGADLFPLGGVDRDGRAAWSTSLPLFAVSAVVRTAPEARSCCVARLSSVPRSPPTARLLAQVPIRNRLAHDTTVTRRQRGRAASASDDPTASVPARLNTASPCTRS